MKTLPVTVSNLECEFVYQTYVQVLKEKYELTRDCGPDNPGELLNCLALLSNTDCVNTNCLCKLRIPYREFICGSSDLISCNVSITNLVPDPCTTPFNIYI